MLAVTAGFVWQALILGGMTMAIILLLTAIGGWAALRFLPQSEALRWPIFAPVVGLGLVSIVGLPLVLLDLPVARWALPLAAMAILPTVFVVVQLTRSAPGRRLLASYLRLRWGRCLSLLGIPVLILTGLIAVRGQGDVRDIWGSSDFAAYWSVADYLQENGATQKSYDAQRVFQSPDIPGHIGTYARLGCMVQLAFLGALLAPTAVDQIINPAILATVVLMVSLAHYWFEQEKVRWKWALIALIGHPFLYFLPYFSYASQASGVVLFVAGLLLANRARRLASPRVARRCIAMAAALLAASILHYPSMLVASGVFWLIFLLAEIRVRRASLIVAGSTIAALVCAYYMPRTVRELILAREATWGWDWRGLIGSLEFVGLRSVLGFSLPEPRGMVIRLADGALTLAIAFLLWQGIRQTRLWLPALTLLVTTGLLAGMVILRIVQHVPSATHAFVKVVSTFAVFILLLVLLPIFRLLGQPRSPARRLAAGALFGLLAIGHLGAVARGEPQPTRGNRDFVRLARRLVRTAPDIPVRFAFGMQRWFAVSILRDEGRVASAPPLPLPCFHVLHIDQITPSDRPRIVDHEGDYVALLEHDRG